MIRGTAMIQRHSKWDLRYAGKSNRCSAKSFAPNFSDSLGIALLLSMDVIIATNSYLSSILNSFIPAYKPLL